MSVITDLIDENSSCHARIAELEHRCGMYGLELTNEVERRLQAERQLSALKAQEPVAYISGCYRDVIDGKSDRTPLGAELAFVNMGWIGQIPLYAAPVSEAKAQGVVQWPDADEIMQMAFEEGQPADDASGYYFELEEFDLFIERLISEVARLNAAPVQQVSVPDDDELSDLSSSACQMALANGVGEESFMVLARTVRDRCAMIAAAPAAPAADATVRQATDGGRNQSYEGLFDGETEEQRASRLAAHRAKGVV